MLRILLFPLILFSLIGNRPALAESRLALVVGNGAYANTTTLSNPANDARDVAAALKRVGFDVVEAVDADKRMLDGALRSFAEKLAGADVALFFYAGHGLQLGAQNFILPVDAKLSSERDLEFEAVRLDFVLRQMEIDREGKTTIVILDACRDNPLARNLARSMGTRSAAIGRGLAPQSTGVGTFIAFSTQPGNVALDGEGRNSPFTAALVKNITGQGRNLPATMIEVRKEVVATTKGAQVPWDHSALTGDFFFVPSDASPAQGSVSAAPAGTAADVAALQERLRRLEEDAKARETAGANGQKLSDLRARRENLRELTRDLQGKVLTTRMEEGKATDPAEKERRKKQAIDIQMELTRRVLDLRKVEEDIAAIAGPDGSGPSGSATTAAADVPPITPKATVEKSSPLFEVTESVALTGTRISSFRAPSPAHCRDACERESSCAGFQHGKKIGVMGTCELYSRIEGRQEDDRWRSGVRKIGAASSAAEAFGLPGSPTHTKQGFDYYADMTDWGSSTIKATNVDSADACMVVCRNTAGCEAAVYGPVSHRWLVDGQNCHALRTVTSPKRSSYSGETLIVRARK